MGDVADRKFEVLLIIVCYNLYRDICLKCPRQSLKQWVGSIFLYQGIINQVCVYGITTTIKQHKQAIKIVAINNSFIKSTL